MRLNHLDLPVPDVAAARTFYVEHLGFTHIETLGQDGLAILRDADGLVLVLSRLRKTGAKHFPEGFHIGFHLAEAAAVHSLYARLEAAGVVEQPPSIQRGALSFYFLAPGEVLVEVAHRGERPEPDRS